MIATPAVDVKGGRCVQLVGGRPEHERVSLPDPLAVAADWHARGFHSLHVVDLDAALGTGDNQHLLIELLGRARAAGVDVQVGGGIRDDHRARTLLESGADRIVVGTRALDDPDWLASLVERHPGRVIVALDARGGRVLRQGWTEPTPLEVESYLPTLARLPLAGVLWTDVAREGREQGIDREACRRTVEASPHPMWISGGVSTLAELEYLDALGVAGAVLGMAIYTHTLNPRAVAERWGDADHRDS